MSDTASIAETDSRYKSFHEIALNHLNMAIHDEYSEETLLGSLQVLAEQYVVIDQSGFEALKSSGFIKDLQGTTLEDALLPITPLIQKHYWKKTASIIS